VGNKGTHDLSAGDGNNTNPNEAGIFLPSEYSVNGSTLHYDGSVAGGVIAANGGTSTSNFLSRFYGGGAAACSNASYEAQLMAQNEPFITPGMCGWTQGIGYYGDDQDTEFDALDATVAKQYTHGLSFNAQYAWQRAFNYNSGYATWDKAVTPDLGRLPAHTTVRRLRSVPTAVWQKPDVGQRRAALGRRGDRRMAV
jgi:hypothetical protein